MSEEQMNEIITNLTDFAHAKYGNYETIDGVKMVGVHIFIPILANWADYGLVVEVNKILDLLDVMNLSNLMPGRLQFPSILEENGGMRYAALKVDILKRLEANKSKKVVTDKVKQDAEKLIELLMDEILKIGGY